MTRQAEAVIAICISHILVAVLISRSLPGIVADTQVVLRQVSRVPRILARSRPKQVVQAKRKHHQVHTVLMMKDMMLFMMMTIMIGIAITVMTIMRMAWMMLWTNWIGNGTAKKWFRIDKLIARKTANRKNAFS